ncbi:hypothetical protein SDC9_107034 [bioreactor metagenome]|uniref:Stage II sporulation protein R n=1 Tax=bioreactor metagenome TaxID=1076179 RepID=A0A645B543_9ZZZZ|nr:stage II sporulation protein R [Candidatus Metalachnospira sp.]
MEKINRFMNILKKLKVLKKDKKIIIGSLVCGIFITMFVSGSAYAKKVSDDISGSVIRFHVLANSDEEYDQQLKLSVRDEILKSISKDMNECTDREDAEAYLESHTDEITAIAKKVIAEKGYDYEVCTTLSTEHYPVRYYENAVFPEGNYESLRVIIGSGEGHNWWCVMYPPLCLNGEAVGYEDDNMLKEVLSDESYEVVVLSEDNAVPKMKFKVVELWASINN